MIDHSEAGYKKAIQLFSKKYNVEFSYFVGREPLSPKTTCCFCDYFISIKDILTDLHLNRDDFFDYYDFSLSFFAKHGISISFLNYVSLVKNGNLWSSAD